MGGTVLLVVTVRWHWQKQWGPILGEVVAVYSQQAIKHHAILATNSYSIYQI